MVEKRAQDERVFQRLPADLTIKYSLMNSKKQGSEKTFDVSASGIGFSCSRRLKPNTVLVALLEVPNISTPFYVRGYVIWCKLVGLGKYKAGIRLEKTDLMGLVRILNNRPETKKASKELPKKSLLVKVLKILNPSIK